MIRHGAAHNKSGFALIFAIIFIAVLAAALTVAAQRSVSHLRLANQAAAASRCLQGVDYAMGAALRDLSAGTSTLTEKASFGALSARDILQTASQTIPEMPGLTLGAAVCRLSATDGTLVAIRAAASSDGAVRGAEAVFRASDAGYTRIMWREIAP